MNIYEFELTKIDGSKIKTECYKGKVLLIVNVASKCGFTKQYEDLQKLYLKYKDLGFCILGFPCNQFLFEEPSDNKEIMKFCSLKYNVTFDMFSKIKVNGKDTNEFYKYLKDSKKWDKGSNNIKWNFEKFLVDKNGTTVGRFKSEVKPFELEEIIINLLK